MLPNSFRQSFWVVFVPLLIAAGLFWMDELRGYRGEMSLVVVPRTGSAVGAAANIAVLSREPAFGAAVYEFLERGESPLTGKTPAEKKKLWREVSDVRTVGQSDVIAVSSRGADRDDASDLTQAIVAEMVRMASRFYNQKTEIDIRITGDIVVVPSFSAWPHFLVATVLTAMFFTFLFFFIYRFIEWVFPQKMSVRELRDGEYTITPETFKPKVPTYWGHEEHFPSADTVLAPTERAPASSESDLSPEVVDEAVPAHEVTRDQFLDNAAKLSTESVDTGETVLTPDEPEAVWEQETPWPAEVASFSYEAERAGLGEEDEPIRGYVSHAAAPDNLPIIEGPITPLQGAQARLMKADIDATARTLAMEPQNESLEQRGEVSVSSPLPQTHEPTPDEYRRRLNELLSGKM